MARLVAFALLAHFANFWLTKDAPQLDTFTKKLLLVLWLLPLIIALSTAVGMETSLYANGRGRFGEPQRVLKSGLGWALVGMLLAILLNVNYLAVEHNHVSDWSYLKVTSVSKTTQAMVDDLDQQLEVYAFFTQDDEAYPFVNEYLASLAATSKNITVKVLDKDISPVQAEKFRVHKNGNLVLTQVQAGDSDEQAADANDKDKPPPYEKIYLGTELRIARAKLRGLDAWLQKSVAGAVVRSTQSLLYPRHGEFTWDYQRDPRRSLRVVRSLLKKQNFRLRELGLDKGSVVLSPTMWGWSSWRGRRGFPQGGGECFAHLSRRGWQGDGVARYRACHRLGDHGTEHLSAVEFFARRGGFAL